MYLNTHLDQINEIYLVEKDLPENSMKQGIQLRSEIARRLLNEADAKVQEEMKNSVEAEFEASQRRYEHLMQAPTSDPIIRQK
jgi:hypothetical protein